MKALLATLALGLATMFTISTHAATALNASTVQGDYLIKAKDVYLVALVRLGATDATLTLEGDDGQVTCSGAYSFDTKTSIVETSFPNCGEAQISIAHVIDLSGQTVESLKANPTVNIAITMGADSIPAIPFTIQKLK